MVVCRSIISNYIDIFKKMTTKWRHMTSEMRNEYFDIKKPRYQILLLKTLQKEVPWSFLDQLLVIL